MEFVFILGIMSFRQFCIKKDIITGLVFVKARVATIEGDWTCIYEGDGAPPRGDGIGQSPYYTLPFGPEKPTFGTQYVFFMLSYFFLFIKLY